MQPANTPKRIYMKNGKLWIEEKDWATASYPLEPVELKLVFDTEGTLTLNCIAITADALIYIVQFMRDHSPNGAQQVDVKA
jgi:hypothetical protein